MPKVNIEVPEELAGFIQIQQEVNFNPNRYYISDAQREIGELVAKSSRRAKRMKELNIPYINSTLLYGPPGTGKTSFCKFLAKELDLSLVYLNLAMVVDGAMGKTSYNISRIFHWLEDVECLFLLDEIDCIAIKRSAEAAGTGGELGRITITIMQELDRYVEISAKPVIVGTTNRYDRLDPALLSRFSNQQELVGLTSEEIEEWITTYLKDIGCSYSKKNIREYVQRNSLLTQRQLEKDLAKAVIDWIDGGETEPIVMSHQGVFVHSLLMNETV